MTFYSIMFACSFNLLNCVELPEYTHEFQTLTGCVLYVLTKRRELHGKDPLHPSVVGRCQPWPE